MILVGTDPIHVGSNTRFPESCPFRKRATVGWINWPWLVSLHRLLLARKFTPFSKPLYTWSALHLPVHLHGWICAPTDPHPNPRQSSLKVMWVGCCAVNRGFRMSLGIGLYLVLTEMSYIKNLGAVFRVAALRWAVL